MPARVHTGSFQFDDIQRNADRSITQAISGTPANGIHVEAVSVNGDFTVQHNLNRPIVGFICVSCDGLVNVFKASSDNTSLTLTGDADGVNLTLLVY